MSLEFEYRLGNIVRAHLEEGREGKKPSVCLSVCHRCVLPCFAPSSWMVPKACLALYPECVLNSSVLMVSLGRMLCLGITSASGNDDFIFCVWDWTTLRDIPAIDPEGCDRSQQSISWSGVFVTHAWIVS